MDPILALEKIKKKKLIKQYYIEGDDIIIEMHNGEFYRVRQDENYQPTIPKIIEGFEELNPEESNFSLIARFGFTLILVVLAAILISTC